MSDHMTPEGAIIHPAIIAAWAKGQEERAMNLDEAQALLLMHKIARDHPALMAIVRTMEGAGYPNTAGVIAGFAATLAAEDVETVIGVLARDWESGTITIGGG